MTTAHRTSRLRRGGCAISLGKVCCPLQGGKNAGEDLEPQVVLVAQAVGAPLDHPDLVVEPLDEAERDLVVRLGPSDGRSWRRSSRTASAAATSGSRASS